MRKIEVGGISEFVLKGPFSRDFEAALNCANFDRVAREAITPEVFHCWMLQARKYQGKVAAQLVSPEVAMISGVAKREFHQRRLIAADLALLLAFAAEYPTVQLECNVVALGYPALVGEDSAVFPYISRYGVLRTIQVKADHHTWPNDTAFLVICPQASR